MNKFIQAVKDLDLKQVEQLISKEPKWLGWSEDTGKNALHFLGGVEIAKHPDKAKDSLEILKLLLAKGMDINSVHRIPDSNCGFFPATPLWYAYTRGRNELLYTYLLDHGADPEHCMYAIAWYDDVEAAALFKKHGARIDNIEGTDSPFMASFTWRRFNAARWFLENGANVDFADAKGNTALWYAIKRKYPDEQIRLLLQFGADPDRVNNEGVSTRKLAETNRQKKILSLFEHKK
jgi:hypothetical protein